MSWMLVHLKQFCVSIRVLREITRYKSDWNIIYDLESKTANTVLSIRYWGRYQDTKVIEILYTILKVNLQVPSLRKCQDNKTIASNIEYRLEDRKRSKS